MGSLNFDFFGNCFQKKPNSSSSPLSLLPHKPPNLAFISNLFNQKPPSPEPNPAQPGPWEQKLAQFFWEQEHLPDHRHAPQVNDLLNDDPIFEKKENPTEEELKENERWWAEFRSSPVTRFLARAEQVADEMNEAELRANQRPYRREDTKLWRAVPPVIGLDGRPMPRKAQKTRGEADDKFWDFMRHFLFGLWGFRQRPYPPGKPIDVAQAIGFKRLDNRYYDFIMKTGGFFYKDRLGRTRGPMQMVQLKSAWGAGIIDKDTFVWMRDMDEWVPICMIYGMERAVVTWEVKLAAAATCFLHKVQKGIPPWVPLKGQEEKTYKQMQEEAVESKRRDLAVLEANDGVWPGVRIPSHALFLWASGTELTKILEEDHMPNKFIPRDLRLELKELFPSLRPWEVLSVEQAMDDITYGGKWFREDLGHLTAGPPFIEKHNKKFSDIWRVLTLLGPRYQRYLSEVVPESDKLLKKVEADMEAMAKKRNQRRRDEKVAKEVRAVYDLIRRLQEEQDEKSREEERSR